MLCPLLRNLQFVNLSISISIPIPLLTIFNNTVSFNPSIAMCWKGCDYGMGRVNSEEGRKEGVEMCKRMTAETMYTDKG